MHGCVCHTSASAFLNTTVGVGDNGRRREKIESRSGVVGGPPQMHGKCVGFGAPNRTGAVATVFLHANLGRLRTCGGRDRPFGLWVWGRVGPCRNPGAGALGGPQLADSGSGRACKCRRFFLAQTQRPRGVSSPAALSLIQDSIEGAACGCRPGRFLGPKALIESRCLVTGLDRGASPRVRGGFRHVREHMPPSHHVHSPRFAGDSGPRLG